MPTGSRTGGKKRAKQKVKCTCSWAAAAFPCFLLTDRVYLVSLISPLATHLSPLPSTTLPSALPVRSAEVGLEGRTARGGVGQREREERGNKPAATTRKICISRGNRGGNGTEMHRNSQAFIKYFHNFKTNCATRTNCGKYCVFRFLWHTTCVSINNLCVLCIYACTFLTFVKFILVDFHYSLFVSFILLCVYIRLLIWCK